MTAALLTKLDGYMSAAGFDIGHPWRSEIAAALAIHALNPRQCPTHLAASAVEAVDLGIFIADEIALMMHGLHERADRALDGLTLAQVKRRMTSLRRLILVSVQFADGRSDMLREVHSDLHRAPDALKTDMRECWIPVGPGSMPPAERPVIVWNAESREPCVVFHDPAVGWVLQCDPTTLHEGPITHWQYCRAPADADNEGVAP